MVLLLVITPRSPAYAHDPGDACPNPDEIVGGGADTSFGAGGGSNDGQLICDGSTNTLKALRIIKSNPIRQGIATLDPQATLDVNGEVKVGKTTLACTASAKGVLRYDATSNSWTYCNGSAWVPFESAGGTPVACSDAAPAAFSFTDQNGVAASTLITSNIVQLTGFDCLVATSISGVGSPQYQICGNATCGSVLQDWTSGASSVSSGQYVRLRLTSNATAGVENTATFLAGGTSGTPWSVTTFGVCLGTPAVGTVCENGTVYAGLTPDGNAKMYVTRCDVGQTWDGSACTGTQAFPQWGSYGTYRGIINAVTGDSNTASWAAVVSAGEAARLCSDLVDSGFSDWYVPAFDELGVICAGKAAIGNFSGRYWSSTEFNSTREKGYVFSNCSWSNMDSNWEKNKTLNAARCARHD